MKTRQELEQREQELVAQIDTLEGSLTTANARIAELESGAGIVAEKAKVVKAEQDREELRNAMAQEKLVLEERIAELEQDNG